jgi:hypothetical protein
MAKPYNHYQPTETVEITTPTSDLGLRSPLIIKLTKSPVEKDGRWIAEGVRLNRKTAKFGVKSRRWIATTISPRYFR